MNIEQAREVSKTLQEDGPASLSGSEIATVIEGLIAELATLKDAHDLMAAAMAVMVHEANSIKQQEPVAYLAWRDGKPCWEGDDCVCADAVYPVDSDDDRTSMPLFRAAGAQPVQQETFPFGWWVVHSEKPTLKMWPVKEDALQKLTEPVQAQERKPLMDADIYSLMPTKLLSKAAHLVGFARAIEAKIKEQP